ncbi:hypothetical protein KC957_02500 [Candidatus Saccharibacteria bacterium]|nr:hypothetical protein [Candidatus Saccharibacteria bacterium]
MKRLLIVLTFLLTTGFGEFASDANVCLADLLPLTDTLILDVTYIPSNYDTDILVRLYDFLAMYVVQDCRSPFSARFDCEMPVIVRYVPFDQIGVFPKTAASFAGLCDVIWAQCDLSQIGYCLLSDEGRWVDQEPAYLAIITTPDENDPHYLAKLWGLTAHEIAHTLGAVDGPLSPFYEHDNILAPIDPLADSYYWFGAAHLFEPGYQGIVLDAWSHQCRDTICQTLHDDVFRLTDPAKGDFNAPRTKTSANREMT